MTNAYYFNEQRRNDPELQAKVSLVVEARKAALAKAAEKLREALVILDSMQDFTGDPIYTRCVNAAWIAHNKVSGDAQFMSRPTTDTYIGNMAASELGGQIISMGDRFYEYFPKNVQND
jgi:hypothetical protein